MLLGAVTCLVWSESVGEEQSKDKRKNPKEKIKE